MGTTARPIPRQPGAWRGWFDPRGRQLGTWAYALNRLTGILLTIYIFFHFVNISFLWLGEGPWNQLMAIFRTWPFLLFDVGLVLVLLYHGLNGIRLGLLALNIGMPRQKTVFWTLMAVGAVAAVVMSIGLFTHG